MVPCFIILRFTLFQTNNQLKYLERKLTISVTDVLIFLPKLTHSLCMHTHTYMVYICMYHTHVYAHTHTYMCVGINTAKHLSYLGT